MLRIIECAELSSHVYNTEAKRTGLFPIGSVSATELLSKKWHAAPEIGRASCRERV